MAEIQRNVDAYFNEYQKQLGDTSNINLISVNSNTKSILRIWPNVPAEEFKNKMDSLMQMANEERVRQEVACNH